MESIVRGGSARLSGSIVRVVVANDDPNTRTEICRLLLRGSDQRYEFIEAETGESTVQAVLHGLRGPPDCVVLDYHLPDADAPEVLDGLVGPDGGCMCPVVVLTDDDGTAGAVVLRAGAQGYLGKSWMTPESMTRALESAIERHRMSRELRDREAFYRQMLELIPGLVFTYTPDGACDYVNEQWHALTGVPAAELLGDGWVMVVHPEDRPGVLEAWQAAIEHATPFAFECRVRRFDGAYEWFKVRGRAIRDAGGALARWFGVAANVDDLKRAEQVLAEADRRKDDFLATLAHELRNPLAPIRSGLEILRAEAPNERAAKVHDMMGRQLAHLIRLVDDLLDIARISRGMIELRSQRVQVSAILEHAVETNRSLVEAGGHRLVVRVPDESVWVFGDLTRLAQVIGNLLDNAAKYTHPGGSIELSASVEGGQVSICVSDDGIGIATEMLPRVFDLFTQVNRTQGGLGIGLSLVRTLVEMHGGTIVAQSPGLGGGSSFTVRLPLAGVVEQGTSVVGAPSHAQPSCRILVVDDNADAAESLAMLLSLTGHESKAVHSGAAALELTQDWRPDVVFLDLGMPGMDGFELARRLRSDRLTADVVLVALTGWGSAKDQRRSREAGLDLHMTKPVSLDAVMNVLSRIDSRHHDHQ